MKKNETNTTQGSGTESCGTEVNKGRNKSVHFECEADISSCESVAYGGWHMKKTGSPNHTPVILSEEMQTPGTAYPATLKDLPNDKLVKSQFVYPNSRVGKDVSKNKRIMLLRKIQGSRANQLSSLIMQLLHHVKMNLQWKKACLLG